MTNWLKILSKGALSSFSACYVCWTGGLGGKKNRYRYLNICSRDITCLLSKALAKKSYGTRARSEFDLGVLKTTKRNGMLCLSTCLAWMTTPSQKGLWTVMRKTARPTHLFCGPPAHAVPRRVRNVGHTTTLVQGLLTNSPPSNAFH